MTIGVLTTAERTMLDRNLLAFYEGRERLQAQLQDIVAQWEEMFDVMDPAWQRSEAREQAQASIEVLRDTISVLDEDAVLPIGEYDLPTPAWS